MDKTRKSSKSITKKTYSLNKLDKLILKLDDLENRFYNLPKSFNNSIKQFVDNNKYILLGLAGLIVATLGYNAYSYTKRVVAPSGEKINKVLYNLNNIIYSDDSKLNDTQKLIKYIYLYSVTVPSDENLGLKINELYQNKKSFLVKDIINTVKPTLYKEIDILSDKLLNDTYPNIVKPKVDSELERIIKKSSDELKYKILPDSINEIKSAIYSKTLTPISSLTQGITNAPATIGGYVGGIASGMGRLFATSLKDQYKSKNQEILELCYNKLNKSNKTFNEFLETIDLEKAFLSNLDECYTKVSELQTKYTDSDKADECKPIGYNQPLLNYLVNIYDKSSSLEQFNECYNKNV